MARATGKVASKKVVKKEVPQSKGSSNVVVVHPKAEDDIPEGFMAPVYIHRMTNPTDNEVPGLPRSEGPTAIKNNHGAEVLSRKREISLADPNMSAGAFRWLWEVAEHAVLEHHRRYGVAAPVISDAGIEAVTALRHYAKANGLVDLKSKRIVKKKTEEQASSRVRTRAAVTTNGSSTSSKSKKVVVKKKAGK